jgi:hypothetical protein
LTFEVKRVEFSTNGNCHAKDFMQASIDILTLARKQTANFP